MMHVMYSGAICWSRGQVLWWVTEARWGVLRSQCSCQV